MRKEYYNYVVKLPVLLHELFRGKVADYHFSDMTVVMNHLVKSYIRMTDGGRVSTATRRILLCMDRIPDMSFFFRARRRRCCSSRWIRCRQPTACHRFRGLGQPPASCRPPGMRFLLRCRCDVEQPFDGACRRRGVPPSGRLSHTYLREQLPVRVPEGDGRCPAHERGGYADGRR